MSLTVVAVYPDLIPRQDTVTKDTVTMALELRILGELEASRDGRGLSLPKGNARRLLSMLIAGRGRTVSDDSLVDRLWLDRPPPKATFSLRNLVVGLRKVIGSDTIERTGTGYRLTDAFVLDADRFDGLVTQGRRSFNANDLAGADEAVSEAMALVRGPAFGDVRDEAWAIPIAHTIDEQVYLAEELWASVRLHSGHAGAHLARLEAAAHAQPERELRWQQLVEAATASGRRTEALRAAQQARHALAEFGILPGAALLAAERAALGAEEAAPGEPPGARRLEAERSTAMAGRAGLLERLVSPRPITWLTGATGHGKTRLLAEIAHRARADGNLVAYVAAERSGTGLQLIADLARDLLAVSPSGSSMPTDLALLLGDGRRDNDAAAILPSADILRVRMRAALVDLLVTASTRSPVVVIVDNAQWLSGESTDTIVHLVDRSPPAVRFMVAGRPVADPDASSLFAQLARSRSMFTCLVEPLGSDDIDELVARGAPDLDDARRGRLARTVLAASAGDPLLANELIRHRLDVGVDEGATPALEALVAQTLAELDDPARAMIEAMALIGRASKAAMVAAAAGTSPDETARAVEELRAARVIAETFDDMMIFRLELYGEIAHRHQRPAALAIQRRRLVNWLVGHDGDPIAIAGHLLALDRRTAIEQRLLDQAVTAALRAPWAVVDQADAIALARAYLAATTGTGEATITSVRAQIFVATALLARGEVDEGRALLDVATERARAFDDPDLLADALLARGPTQLGGPGSRRTSIEAEQLLARVRPDDVARRVQLACWAAHNRLNRGERAAAWELLDAITPVASMASAPVWRSLVLAVRAQGEQLVGGDARRATAALDDLAAWSRLTGDETAAAAWRVMGMGVPFMTGTLDDVRAARERAVEVGQRLPRPDVRWLPTAVSAALELAVGELDAAAIAIDEAERRGRELGVGGAVRGALLQRTVLMTLAGTLGSLTALLEPVGSTPNAPSEALSTYGLACAYAGDGDGAARAASILSTREHVLSSVGSPWPVVAMAGAELAWRTGNAALADCLWTELHRWSGSGLSMYGIVYVGAADLWLGALAAAGHRTSVAVALLDGAIEQERRRGAHAWERRAIALRDEIAGAPAR